MTDHHTQRARELRQRQTIAESLLWSVLRARQLSGLKFHRQQPVGPFFADFACAAHKLIVEIDGGYHDYTCENDQTRQQFLESQGWSVLRFSNEAVSEDVEAVAIAIAKHLGIAFNFRRRKGGVSGMVSAKRSRDELRRQARAPSPGPGGPTSPGGRGDRENR